MANEEHLTKLREGVEAWNAWREGNPEIRPNLRGANLRGANLRGANLRGANLIEAVLAESDLIEANFYMANLAFADLSEAILHKAELSRTNLIEAKLSGAKLTEVKLIEAKLVTADLSGANLSGTTFYQANLTEAKLREANLTEAFLREANLTAADLSGANLQGADLSYASIVQTNLAAANLDGSQIYAASVWDVEVDSRTSQHDLVITPIYSDIVTVDDLEVAQFIYLLLENRRLRKVIDTITSKVVLILGRFTDERKHVLDGLRNELRKRNFTPVLFDFEKPDSRDLTETIFTLASMARFVIADITDAKSIPQELSHIIPNLPSVPIQPVLLASDRKYAMFEHWKRYPWVLPDFLYRDEAHLLASFSDKVIGPAERKRQEQSEM